MNIGQLILEALESLNSNKLRTGLTILGIVIGVAAVIAMLGVGQGASNSITNQINSLGTNLLFVSRSFGARGQTNPQPLTIADATALGDPSQAPDVAQVSPVINGNATLTAAGVKFRADLIQLHKVMPSPTFEKEVEGTQTWYMFVNGTAAMYISGIWKTAYFRETVKDFPWDVTLMPQGTGGQRRFAMGGSAYGVSKSSKNKKLAWKLVRFLTGEEGLGKLAATGVAHPARVKVAESPDFLDGKDPQNKKVMLGTIPYGRIPPMCLNWQEAQVMINAELEDVWRGKATVEEAMKRLRPKLEANPPITSKR